MDDFQIVNMPEMLVVGIETKTSGKKENLYSDVESLWSRFFREGVMTKIPNQKDNEVLNIYSEYKDGNSLPVNCIMGKRVEFIDKKLPKGVMSIEIPAGKYMKFTAKGALPGCVREMWDFIHELEPEFSYAPSFDVYGPKTADPDNAEVDIYVAVQ